ncbi:DUF222 domain-containing protein [Gordonia sp. VNK21]|uniref:HNH endonuclease signature motif containing protein n=1 Tax=Gordonia sp. VNK21 TaxID=3382483 RepID=UPI0038D43E18
MTTSIDDTSTMVLPDDPIALQALITAAAAKQAKLTRADYTRCTDRQLTDLTEDRERARRLISAADAPLLVEISDRGSYQQAGGASLGGYLVGTLHLSAAEARRRRLLAEAVGQFTSMTGEPLPPRCPTAAAALADGTIGADHVTEIFKTMQKIPHAVDADQRARAERDLTAAAVTLTPEQTRMVGHRLLSLLDPDGELADDTDRQRRRSVTLSPQDQQLMTTLRGSITPALRSLLEVVLTKWAAPGMNNPDDPDSPTGPVDADGLDPELLDAARRRDLRSAGQRNHDALVALCRFALGHGALGDPSRLPAEFVVTIDEKDLAELAGTGYTATGTHIPIPDLIDMAAHATWHLAVFAHHSAEVLYLGRSRFANKAQRLAMFARDRGCTRPGCTRPFAQCEAHHADLDYADGGTTDINTIGGACGGDNRHVSTTPGHWETTIITDGPHTGRVGWRITGTGHDYTVNPMHHIGRRTPHNPHSPPEGA